MARPRTRACTAFSIALVVLPALVARAEHDRGSQRNWRRDDFEAGKYRDGFRLQVSHRVMASVFWVLLCVISASAQTTGNSSLSGVVADPTGAVVPGATVEIHNPVSQFSRSTTTDSAGRFSFPNIPFNPYHLSVNVTGFAAYSQDVDVHSAVPLSLKITLQIARLCRKRHGARRSERSVGKRSDVPHRRGPQSVRQASAGELFLGAEFAGHAGLAGSRCRFQRPVSRTGRPRRELVFSGWPADHRPAEQGILQPDSARRRAVDDGDRRSAAG